MALLILIVVGVAALWTARNYRVIGRRSTDIDADIDALSERRATGPAKANAYHHQVQA